MFCKYCGKEIDEDSKFCPKCGKEVTETVRQVHKPVQPPPEPAPAVQFGGSTSHVLPNEIYNSKLIKRQNYRSSALGGQIFAVVIFVIAFAIETALVVTDPGPFSRWRSSDEQFIKTILTILLIGDFICIIIAMIKIAPIKNTFVCVTEAGIYGSGGSPLYFAAKPFCLSFQEVTDVKVYPGGIIIENFGNTFKCAIDNESMIASIIRDHSQKNKNENRNSPRSGTSRTNMWTCPSCGKSNPNYVGTCGCGMRKA